MKKSFKILLGLIIGLSLVSTIFFTSSFFQNLKADFFTNNTEKSTQSWNTLASAQPHPSAPQPRTSEIHPAAAAASLIAAIPHQVQGFLPTFFADCTFQKPQNPDYSARFISVKKDAQAQPGTNLEIRVMVENTGNMPWFSLNSGCSGVPNVNLGTIDTRDHESVFFPGLSQEQNAAMGWQSANRILMSTPRVDPGQVATFIFQTKILDQAGYYREYLAPVVEGTAWMEDNALFYFDINVGNVQLSENQQKYVPYLEQSGNLAALNLDGDKKLEVSLREQKLYIKVGDQTIRTFQVSTGKYDTPTPRGSYQIMLKQDVRVAGEWPHYIMPKFMMFRNGGYGFHALPSLANDHGVFWQEALDHIGSARSHGCVRLLPDDAEFAYNFADVGTKVEIRL